MTATPPVLEMDGHLATLTLSRPEQGNRLSDGDLDVLVEHFATINASSARVVRLCALGRHFCAGYDVSDLASGAGGERFEATMDALAALRPITVAEVQGGAYGGASDLLLACDFRLGSHAARVSMPAARFGLHLYGGILRRYVSRLGLNTAKRMILNTEPLEAQEMFQLGLLTHPPCAAEELAARSQAIIDHLMALAPLALEGMKRHLNAIADGCFETRWLHEDIDRCKASRDFREGLQAIKDKRPAVFDGC
ncbi:enoyl-CoA hydratase/isomerase family protein [Halomonas sp. HK25]|uniref:enoyl-CoA hydratase/isomerase family protein n=1 Tax=Halomonas sp. HK25 TaxID=3394321 RepID=UPI0039FD7EA7